MSRENDRASDPLSQLVDVRRAAEIVGQSVSTLAKWRHEGIGPAWTEAEGVVSYDVNVLLEYVEKHAGSANVSGLFTVAMEIATKRASTIGEMRKALESSDERRALELAKELCGLRI
jgi:hypothetical protein